MNDHSDFHLFSVVDGYTGRKTTVEVSKEADIYEVAESLKVLLLSLTYHINSINEVIKTEEEEETNDN